MVKIFHEYYGVGKDYSTVTLRTKKVLSFMSPLIVTLKLIELLKKEKN